MTNKKRYGDYLLQVRIPATMKQEMDAFAQARETDLSDMTRRAIRLMLDMAKVQAGKDQPHE